MSRRGLKSFLSLIFMGLFMGVIVSCGSEANSTVSTTDTVEMVTVTDQNGTVEVKKDPKVIVTFDYGVLDILDSMGIEIAGLPKESLPNRFSSKYSDEKYVDLGGLKEPDFESINALKPDLIIISGRQADMYDKFSEIAPTLLLSIDGGKYMEDFKRNVETLSTIFGNQEIQSKKLEEIDNKIKEINDFVTANQLNALTIMVNEGALSTYGVGSRYGLIYNELGFKPVDESIEISTHGQQISFEYIVDKNPDYIFVIDRGAALGNEGTAQSILDNDLIKSTDAYKNGRILYMDSQSWYTIAGGFSSTETMLNDIWGFIKNNPK